MPTAPLDNPSEYLFRGSPLYRINKFGEKEDLWVEPGKYIPRPKHTNHTFYGDPGRFLFAAINKLHAIAYAAFKDRAGVAMSIGPGCQKALFLPFVFLDNYANGNANSFDDINNKPGILQKVSSENFKGVFSPEQLDDFKRPKPGEEPGEYASEDEKGVRVLRAWDRISADYAIRQGVQVFVIYPREKNEEDCHSIRKLMIEGNYEPRLMAKLINEDKVLSYINARKFYRDCPKARWEALAEIMPEIKPYRSPMPPSTPSHPQTPGPPETRPRVRGNSGAGAPSPFPS